MAKKKWLHKILAILPSISLIVILLISSFEIGAYGDWNFYEKEYEKYKVADELYMEMPDIMKVTKFMMSYLRGNEKKLSIETEVEGNIQDFFNEKDRLHMADVQGLFLGGLAIRRGAIIVLLFSMVALVLMKADWKRLIPQMYQRVLAVFLALTAVAGFLFSRDFNKYFVNRISYLSFSGQYCRQKIRLKTQQKYFRSSSPYHRKSPPEASGSYSLLPDQGSISYC